MIDDLLESVEKRAKKQLKRHKKGKYAKDAYARGYEDGRAARGRAYGSGYGSPHGPEGVVRGLIAKLTDEDRHRGHGHGARRHDWHDDDHDWRPAPRGRRDRWDDDYHRDGRRRGGWRDRFDLN